MIRKKETTFEVHLETGTINEETAFTSPETQEREVVYEGAPIDERERERTMDAKCMKYILTITAIAAVVIIILVTMSFSDLDYFQMGFKKSKISGAVDTSKVYFGGRHFLGITSTFKTFKADAHLIHFDKLTIFNQEKIQVTLSCSLQYMLRPEDLKLLHDRFDINYQPVLTKTAASAIKNTASKYSIVEYRLQRLKIAQGLADGVALALGGTCCRVDCGEYECRPGCMDYTMCNSTDKGLFADVVHFQLKKIDITDGQEKRFLQQVLEQELKDTEEYKQNETITRKKTEEEKKLIENEACSCCSSEGESES